MPSLAPLPAAPPLARRVLQLIMPKGALVRTQRGADPSSFNRLDLNADGQLSVEELDTALGKLLPHIRREVEAACEAHEGTPVLLRAKLLGMVAATLGVVYGVAVVDYGLLFGLGTLGESGVMVGGGVLTIVTLGFWLRSLSQLTGQRRLVSRLLAAHGSPGDGGAGLTAAILVNLDTPRGWGLPPNPQQMPGEIAKGDVPWDAASWEAAGLPATPQALAARINALPPNQRKAVVQTVDWAIERSTRTSGIQAVLGSLSSIAFGGLVLGAAVTGGGRTKGVYSPPDPETGMLIWAATGVLIGLIVIIWFLHRRLVQSDRERLAAALKAQL